MFLENRKESEGSPLSRLLLEARSGGEEVLVSGVIRGALLSIIVILFCYLLDPCAFIYHHLHTPLHLMISVVVIRMFKVDYVRLGRIRSVKQILPCWQCQSFCSEFLVMG